MARPTKQATIERDLIERSHRLYLDLLNARLLRTARAMNAVVRHLGWEVTERRMAQDQPAAPARRPIGRPRKTEATGDKAARPRATSAGKSPARRGRPPKDATKSAGASRRRTGTRKPGR